MTNHESKQIDDILSDHTLDDIEIIIQKLKEAGFSQIETVKIIINKFGLGLKDADHHVLYSAAWKDNLETNIKLRNAFFDCLEADDEQEN